MSDNQTIHRVYEGSFTTISNVVLHDDTLSFDAVGLLCRIMSLPKDWKLSTSQLRKKYSIGRDKLYRMIDELKAAGYMRYIQPRDDGGRMQKGVYYIAADPRSLAHIEPLPENTDADRERDTEKADPANSASRKTRTHTKETEPTKETDSKKALTRDFEKSGGEGQEETKWRRRLELYRENGKWAPFNRWGPKMGEPGCLVPPHLVKLWNDTNGLAFKPEPKTKRRADDKPFTPRSNGFRQIGTLNLPGTSHD